MPPEQTNEPAPSLLSGNGTPPDGTPPAPAGDDGKTPPPAPTDEKPVEKSGDDGKPDPAAVTKDNPFKPEELKFPDGVIVDEASSKSFVDIVNEFGIPRTAVAKLIDLQQKTMLANSEAGSRDWAKMQEDWAAEVMKDAEIGGQNWPKVQTQIGGLLDKYGSPELRQAFDLTGAGNNPHVVRFMSKVAAVLSEGGFISTNSAGAGERSPAEILYPNQGKQ